MILLIPHFCLLTLSILVPSATEADDTARNECVFCRGSNHPRSVSWDVGAAPVTVEVEPPPAEAQESYLGIRGTERIVRSARTTTGKLFFMYYSFRLVVQKVCSGTRM